MTKCNEERGIMYDGEQGCGCSGNRGYIRVCDEEREEDHT